MENVLFGLIALVGVVMSLAVFVRPETGFVAILVMFPFEVALQSFNPTLIRQYPWAVNAAVALVAFVGVLISITKRKQPFGWLSNASTWLVVGLYAWMFTSLLWTPTLQAATHFIGLGSPYMVLFFVIMPLLVSRLDDLEQIIRPFLILSVFTAIAVFVNPHSGFTRGRLTIDFGYVAGVGDLGSNPLALADLGGMLAIAAALYRPQVWTKSMQALQLVAFLVGLGLALASGSRGQVLGAVAICVVLFPLLSERKSFATFFSVVIGGFILSAVAATLYLVLFSSGQDDRWSASAIQSGTGARLAFAIDLISGYTGQPAFWLQGLGASAFNLFYYDPDFPGVFAYPHNIFVEAIAEYGLLGLTLLMAICFVCAKKWAVLYRNEGQAANTRSICVVLLGFALFQFVMSLKQGAMFNPPMLFSFTILIGKLAKRSEVEAASSDYQVDEWQPDSDELEQLQLAYANEDPRQD